MADSEKIQVSWDEVHSPAVDDKLQQQSARLRMTDHYQRQLAHPIPTVHRSPGLTGLWYHLLFSMTLFGFLGGLCAWPLSEIPWQLVNRSLDETNMLIMDVAAVSAQIETGGLSQEQAAPLFEQIRIRYQGNPALAVWENESLSDAEKEQQVTKILERNQQIGFLRTILFCAFAGMSIAMFLSIADAVVGRNLREAIINGSIGICLGALGGLFVGLILDQLYRALGGGSGEHGMSVQVAARAVGWSMLGFFLAIAPGIVLRSPKKLLIGLAGGFLGGLIGGGVFDVVTLVTGTDWVSRLLGLIAIGTFAGLCTGLIENTAKTGWLKVTTGLIAGKQFILYKNPTIIGSSPQCEIYLFKDIQIAPQHAAIRTIPQGYEIQDQGTLQGTFVNGRPVQRIRLRNLDQVQIGGTTFTFHEKTNASPAVAPA